MDYYTLIIILTAIAFFALAAVLLVPVWRFLGREEEKSRQWIDSSIERDSVDSADENEPSASG
jgi:hypothetical protein